MATKASNREKVLAVYGSGPQIKEEHYSGICCGCLAEHNLKDINTTYYYEGKPEVYSELISYCFSIQVGEELDTPEKLYFICDRCIRKLREAANFRTQIEVSRETFKTILTENKNGLDYISKHEEEWLDEEALLLDDEPRLGVDDGRCSDSDDDEKPLVKPRASKVAGGMGKRRRLKKKKPRIVKIIDEEIKKEAEEAANEKKTPTAKRYKKKEELPYRLEKTDLKCKICGETFPVHKGLQMHMPVHFPNHICEQCGRWFATRTQLYCHTISHTTAVEACPICPGRVFKATGSLKAHMRRHQGQTDNYKCSICPERFTSYNARRRHLVATHGEENKKYACKHCPKRFCLQSHLSVHVRSIHLQERTHVCLQCDSSFFSSRGLRFHMLKHTGERDFECPVCKKRYGRKYTLKEHLKIHSGERAHTCYVCGKTFTQRCTLKGHMVVHEKEINVQTKFEVL